MDADWKGRPGSLERPLEDLDEKVGKGQGKRRNRTCFLIAGEDADRRGTGYTNGERGIGEVGEKPSDPVQAGTTMQDHGEKQPLVEFPQPQNPAGHFVSMSHPGVDSEGSTPSTPFPLSGLEVSRRPAVW
jgi:hypothetical protein